MMIDIIIDEAKVKIKQGGVSRFEIFTLMELIGDNRAKLELATRTDVYDPLTFLNKARRKNILNAVRKTDYYYYNQGEFIEDFLKE